MDQHIDHARTGHFDVDHAREQAAAGDRFIERMLNFRSRLITSAMWLIIPVVSLATTRIDTRNAPCASSRQRLRVPGRGSFCGDAVRWGSPYGGS